MEQSPPLPEAPEAEPEASAEEESADDIPPVFATVAISAMAGCFVLVTLQGPANAETEQRIVANTSLPLTSHFDQTKDVHVYTRYSYSCRTDVN